jgi:hypothetical protein
MRSRIKLIVTALAAAALLATATGAATANNLSASEGDIRSVLDDLTLESDLGNIICDVTLEGSFHSRTIRKAAGTLIGHITRAVSNLAGCTDTASGEPNGSVNNESLPWNVRYTGFEGTLPEIERVFLVINNTGFRVLGVPILGNCDYLANVPGFANTLAASTTLESEPTIISSQDAFCPDGRFVTRIEEEAAPVTDLGGSTAIVIRLI